MELRQPRLPCSRQRVLERELRLGGEADDYVRGQVEVVERLELAKVGRDVVAASHRLQNAVVARLQRDVQMLRDSRRLAQRLDQLRRDVVDLDRGEAQPLESRRGGDIANQARQREPGIAVAEAAEVDSGQDDLAMPLRDAAANLADHRLRAPAPRPAADERDDAEVARERAAVLDLDEGAHAFQARVSLDAADRADVAGDKLRGLVASAGHDDDVLRQVSKRLAVEVRAAARDVD